MGKTQDIIDSLKFMLGEDGRRNQKFHTLESKIDEVDKKISDLREIIKLILEKVK
ncbi:hypothetical protein LCGC14_2179560 [marine sediment metagenome]|uniref:Uncharacterized protein n=1 Tax=marine sediment metagenome TaxID=412755 RepID=A0A0F9GIK0_9ZZZZ